MDHPPAVGAEGRLVGKGGVGSVNAASYFAVVSTVADRSAEAVAFDAMPLRTRRWNDPVEPDDGHRLLVCRYRPRGVRKDAETWDAWWPHLGPSRELHADYYGKQGPPIGWTEYRRRYLAEMKDQRETIAALAARVAGGETITLLCSSACTDPERCHRSLLRALILSAPRC